MKKKLDDYLLSIVNSRIPKEEHYSDLKVLDVFDYSNKEKVKEFDLHEDEIPDEFIVAEMFKHGQIYTAVFANYYELWYESKLIKVISNT